MARDLSKILVVDVEATCWEGFIPPGQVQEILEVGFAILHRNGDIEGPYSHMVRPTSSEVTDFCTTLTGITPEMAAEGGSFLGACQAVEAQDSKFCAWASWGDFDRFLFERQCARVGVPYPFTVPHINVKYLYSWVYGLKKELGMAKALDHAKMHLMGTHHRAGDDAYNIARLLSKALPGPRP